jgi:hypothetical protein
VGVSGRGRLCGRENKGYSTDQRVAKEGCYR